jgi:signal transduction histidine kinase
LINDILDISKIEAGQLAVERVAFDLRTLVERTVASFSPRLATKGLTLALQLPPSCGPARGDPLRVEQILLNLLSNGVKFTERGQIKVELLESATTLAVQVSDTGIGIRTEDLAQLFRPFQQVRTPNTRHIEGTGLGLAICRRLAALMDGEVHAVSEYGHGSTFSLILPRATA